MRTVTLKQLDYESYEIIYRAIMETMPFALVNQGYNKRLKTGFFNFWDSDYIPPQLERYIMRPPFHEDNVKRLDSMIINLIQESKKPGENAYEVEISDKLQVVINERIIDNLVGKLKELKVPEEELAELFKLAKFKPAPDIESEPCPNCNKYTQRVDFLGVIHCGNCLAKSTDEKYPVKDRQNTQRVFFCTNCEQYTPKEVTEGIKKCDNCNFADPEENPNIILKAEIRCNHCKMIGYGKEPIHKDDCVWFNPDGTQKDAKEINRDNMGTEPGKEISKGWYRKKAEKDNNEPKSEFEPL